MQFEQLERRQFITLLSGATVLWPLASVAQQAAKVPLIGALVIGNTDPFGGCSGKGCAIWGTSKGKTFDLSFDRRKDRLTDFPNWPPSWSVSKSM